MKKIYTLGIVCLIFLKAQSQVDSNTEFLKIGNKWRYNYSQGLMSSIQKNGFIELELEKDTILENYNCKKIGVTQFLPRESDSTLISTFQTPIFLKTNNGIIQYRFLSDTFWFTLYDSSWKLNDTFNIDVRKYWREELGTGYENVKYKVVDEGITTFSGKAIPFIELKPLDSTNFFLYPNIWYKNIGFGNYFINTLNYMALDSEQANGIRCFENTIQKLIKFNSSNCDIFSIQDYSNTPPCPNIKNCGTTVGINESIINTETFISPNPAVNYVEIINLSIKFSDFNIYNIDGMKIKSGKVESNIIEIQTLKKGMYFLELSNNYEIKIFKFIKE